MRSKYVTFVLLALFSLTLSSSLFAQDDAGRIDPSKVANTGAKASDFAPRGWQIEKEIKGDVNADGLSDSVLMIQETKALEGKQRGRALVIIGAQKDKSWKTAVVADRLLQCVECGDMMGEIDIKIKNGVVIVTQYQGRNGSNSSNETYRFRWEPSAARFRLIGADYVASGGPDKINTESTNYLTGDRKTTRSKGNRDIPSSTRVPITKTYLDEIDSSKLDEAAFLRIGG